MKDFRANKRSVMKPSSQPQSAGITMHPKVDRVVGMHAAVDDVPSSVPVLGSAPKAADIAIKRYVEVRRPPWRRASERRQNGVGA
jgi:hypothetical protein